MKGCVLFWEPVTVTYTPRPPHSDTLNVTKAHTDPLTHLTLTYVIAAHSQPREGCLGPTVAREGWILVSLWEEREELLSLCEEKEEFVVLFEEKDELVVILEEERDELVSLYKERD